MVTLLRALIAFLGRLHMQLRRSQRQRDVIELSTPGARIWTSDNRKAP